MQKEVILSHKLQDYVYETGPILESKGMCAIFQKKGKKMLRKGKKGQNIQKFWQKFTKCENLLKKGGWLQAIITHNKLLE